MSFGLSPFGGVGSVSDPGAFGELPASYAVAVGTNTVRVYLPAQPLFASDAGAGDARNPLVWSVQNVATGFSFTITKVTIVDPTTLDVHVLENLSGRWVTHEIYSTGMLLAAGGEFQPQPDHFFPGVEPAKRPPPFRLAVSDLANPQIPKPGGGQVGTLQIGSSGDYSNVSGAEMVRKLLFRRLSTPLGAFFHLPGYGVAPNVKGIYPQAELRRLKAELERQAREEPEVSAVRVSVTLGADNIMTIVLLARLSQTNETISMSFQADATTGRIVL